MTKKDVWLLTIGHWSLGFGHSVFQQMQAETSTPVHLDNAWPHRIAVTLCCAVFPLIWVGGLVTTYDAGMAVPDWPTTFGYNLFAYPWKTWLFGPFDLFIEHGHRLLGATVGVLAIAFLIAVFRFDSRKWMRYAAFCMLAFVVAQGILGGLRVRLDDRSVAMIHACFGLATFAFSAAMATLTSRSWHARSSEVQSDDVTGLLRLAVVTAAITYMQVLLGALLRHTPVAAGPAVFRAAVWFHIACGSAIAIHVLMLAIRSRRQKQREVVAVRHRIQIMTVLVLVQLALGMSTWVMKYGWPAWFANQAWAASFTIQANSLPQAVITTLHMAIGALILSLSVVVALRLGRIHRLASHCHSPQSSNSQQLSLFGPLAPVPLPWLMSIIRRNCDGKGMGERVRERVRERGPRREREGPLTLALSPTNIAAEIVKIVAFARDVRGGEGTNSPPNQ